MRPHANPLTHRAGRCSVLGLALASILLVAAPGSASDADRQVLRDRLEFQYVSNISSSTAPLLDTAAIYGGTESGAFWTNGSMANLQTMVRALLRDPANGGDDALQHYARLILNVTPDARKVRVVMFDDVTSTITGGTNGWGGCIQPNGTAWPCATFTGSSTHVGLMWLGPANFTGARRFGTFLHELTHTQDRTDGRAHQFTVGNTNFRYGSDGTHFDVEMIPNLAMTYKEGLANAVRLLYDHRSATRYFRVFSTNDYLWVERNGPPAGSQINPDAWLYQNILAAGGSEATLPPGFPNNRLTAGNYAPFRFRDLPAKFILHNEYVLAMIISNYADHVSADRIFRGVADVNSALFGASGSGIAILFESLCASGLPRGETPASLLAAATSTSDPRPYLIPLAYADYFTNYSTSSAAEFAQLFENQLPDEWIRLYWEGAQGTVRTAVQGPSRETPTVGHLTDIALALNVREQR